MEHERLIIFTLGGLSLTHKGEPVAALVSKKAGALLVYLACEGREISREILADLLWEERGQRQAMANLRVVLTSLRKELGEFVTITRDTVAINRDAGIWLDVDQFEELLSAGEAEKALEIYRGDFLEGLYLRDAQEFEDWAVIQREQLTRKYRDGLDSLVDRAFETGDYPGGIGYANQLLSHDPTRETAHRKLIRLLVYNGQRGAALEQYQECWRILRDELGLEPSKETRDLYQDILDEKIIIPKPEGSPLPKPKKPEFLEKDARDRKPPPLFVAKERQLKKLDNYLQTALEGHGMVAFVCGGPGRGKTALVDEFARRAMIEHTELLIAKGSCNAYSGIGDAYLPFREIMGMLSGDVEGLWKAGTLTTEHARRLWAGILVLTQALLDRGPNLFGTFVSSSNLLGRVSMIKPEETGLVKELCETVEKEQIQPDQMDQTFLFEQITNVLCAISEEHPLILLLDDLQWADKASISLLFHIGRRLEGSRILVLGAYRAEEVAMVSNGVRHPLQKVLAEIKRRSGNVWLDLAKIEDQEDFRFVCELIDSEPNRLEYDFRQELTRQTNGQPLYTLELLRAMQERGDLVRSENGNWIVGHALDWSKLPARVEAVIAERIDRLESEQRAILKTASVEGEVFSVQVVAGVRELPLINVAQILSTELEGLHRLVREQAGLAIDHKTLFRYRFSHNLIQQYLYNGIGRGECKLLHREIANTLEQLAEPDSGEVSGSIVLQLGWHYSQAGEIEKAVKYLVKGGDKAFASHAYEEAKLCFTQALDIFQDQEPEKCANLLYKLGETHFRLADFPPAENYFRKAKDLAHDIGDHKTEIRALHSLSFCTRIQNKYDQAMEYAQQSLDLAEKSGDRAGKMISLKFIGTVVGRSGDILREEEFYKKSLEIAREINDDDEISACLSNLGLTADLRGDVTEAEKLIKEALKIAISINHKWRIAVMMDNLALTIWRRGRSNEARRLLNDGLTISQQIGNFWEMSSILYQLGLISFSFGRYEEAEYYSAKGLEIAKERSIGTDKPAHMNLLGMISLESGRYEKAREYFSEAKDHLIGFNYKEDISWCLCGLGLVDSAQGLYDKALQELNKCLQIAAENEVAYLNGFVSHSLGRVSWVMGNHKEAQSYLRDGLEIFLRIDDRGDMAECYAYLGHNAVSLGEFNSARGYYRHALEISGEIGMMPVIAEALGGIAVLLSQMGEPLKAVNLTAFVNGQKECSYATRERARNLLEDFSQETVPDEFEGAKNDGESMGLEGALKIIEPALIA